MVAGLETFAKVRALHDRTDNPGEKAAAASRMEALARTAGMTVADAVSKLDRMAAHSASGVDWSTFADAFWRSDATARAADAPEASSRLQGLPIYDPNKVEPWRAVAEHCLQLDWIIPKAHGGRFLTKAERERLKIVARHYGPVTNATADWIKTVLAQCEAARQSWRDRGKAGVRPDKGATESDIEKAAEMVAAAKRRKASEVREPEGPAATPRNPFEALFNTPEFRAQQAERQRRDAERRAAALAEYGSEDAVFAETEHERALEAACRPLIVRKPIIGGDMDTLLGWDFVGGGDFRPEVREAVATAYDLPARPREAWEEWQGWDRLYRNREAFFRDYDFPVWVQARRHVVEELLNEAPAQSMNDLRARLSWIDYLRSIDILGQRTRDDALFATLRADIERMGARIRDEAAPRNGGVGAAAAGGSLPDDQGLSSPDLGSADGPPIAGHQTGGGPEGVQGGQTDMKGTHETRTPAEQPLSQRGHAPTEPAEPALSGVGGLDPIHPRRTNADKRRDVLALLNLGNSQVSALSDREIARRAGVSPQTVGNIRRSLS